MSALTLPQVQHRYGRTWDVMDFYGGWVAIRRHPWSEEAAARYGIANVLGADTLDELARQLEEQAQAETRRRGRPLPDPGAVPPPSRPSPSS
ncbi:hypothetical protein Skr01_36130 [Sphaerisporangium krabiense]|uniref:Uncharacterized protein n=1 Tax=Sphaerisporangium krabiense TaxID=763782 RepID=A0A7W8Z393_9ACTN|nr:hypothetical protein [Sphaerisporangium krabiense]MBB5626606.1 hypothetical protein [Sphaerisporangium krabiense]GII63528.1 hypothetical protein Skr01_36130 [Sphaerisporangium krabiense]